MLVIFSYARNCSDHSKYAGLSWRPLNANICILCIVGGNQVGLLDFVAALHI